MKNPVIWLRISYWVGAIVDLKGALLMAFPNVVPGLYFRFFGRTYETTPVFRNLSFLAAAIILAWTILLIWADQKPLERKAVALLTICPIGITIMFLRLLNYTDNFSGKTLPFSIMMFGVIILFGFSYIINSVNWKKSNEG